MCGSDICVETIQGYIYMKGYREPKSIVQEWEYSKLRGWRLVCRGTITSNWAEASRIRAENSQVGEDLAEGRKVELKLLISSIWCIEVEYKG